MIKKTAHLLIAAVLATTIPVVLSGAAGDGRPPGILVSRQLLERRNLHVGDVVRLSPEPSGERSRVFRIDGVYEPMADPMRFAQERLEVRLHLPDLLALTADPADVGPSDTVTAINVRLSNASDARSFADDLSARTPGVAARPTNAADERTSTFVVLDRFHLAIAIVTVVGSAVFLLALMVMLVDERRDMVGILRLIGLTRSRILVQVFAEGAFIAAGGAAAGILFALAMQRFFNQFFQWKYDTTLVFLRITPRIVVESVLMAVPLGVLASLVASWTFLRRGILALLRR
jgi:putative ABC transport system permease protein